MVLRLLSAAVITCALVPSALADTDADEGYVSSEDNQYEVRPSAVSASLGFGTPLGMIGLEVEHSFARWFALSAGIGAGAAGPQGAAAVRIRSVDGLNAYGIGAGVSLGDAKHSDAQYLGERTVEVFDDGVWTNGELYFERRHVAGWTLRGYVGAGVLARANECTRTTMPAEISGTLAAAVTESCDTAGYVLPYLGMSLGKTF